jgi:hypothetical protein
VQALVRFTVGVAGALAGLTVLDRSPREECLVTFLSGLWGMVPDGHWTLHELGLESGGGLAGAHGSSLVDVCWFHHTIDALETGRDNAEAGVVLVVLVVLVGTYYRYDDWTA